MEATKIDFSFKDKNLHYFYCDIFKNKKYIQEINKFSVSYQSNVRYDKELDLVIQSREEQTKLFEKMNYLKYRCHQDIKSHHNKRVLTQLKKVNQIKDILICSNSRLAISTAKKLKEKYFPGNDEDIMTLTSHANLTLIHCLDMFNPFLGFAFSTYAVNAMIRNILSEKQEFLLPFSEEMDVADHRVNEFEELIKLKQAKNLVKKLLSRLQEEDRDLIKKRFGIDEQFYTLDQLAEERNRSKERIRQKQNAIMRMLQKMIRKNELSQIKELCA